MPKTLSEQLDELHEKAPKEPLEKCEHGHDVNKCVPCALTEIGNRERTAADFDNEKRQYRKLQQHYYDLRRQHV